MVVRKRTYQICINSLTKRKYKSSRSRVETFQKTVSQDKKFRNVKTCRSAYVPLNYPCLKNPSVGK